MEGDVVEEFARFVEAHGLSLHGTAVALTGDAGAAEELVQDTLVHLYPRWSLVSRSDAPVAYVRRSLVNRYLAAGRRPRLTYQPPAPERDHADVVTERLTVAEMLTTLNPRQHAAIVLRYLHDYADADIAAALNCRPATVRSLISRGLATLRIQSGEQP